MGKDQSESDENEDDQSGPSEEVLRQAQCGEEKGAEEGERGEAQHQSSDDEVRAQPNSAWHSRFHRRVAFAVDGAGALSAAGEEDHRQYGKYAGGYPGDDSTDEPDQREGFHDTHSELTPPRLG